LDRGRGWKLLLSEPARQGINSNLNLITDKGNIYSFTLQDVSGTAAPDLKVMIEPADRSSIVASQGPLQYVPAAQLDQTRQQLASLQSHVTQAVDESGRLRKFCASS
jgi:type IV secretion system protein VirB9